MKIERLIRPHLLNVKTYSAVDPPEALAERAGIPQDEVVKLNANENPFGPSPKAVEAGPSEPSHFSIGIAGLFHCTSLALARQCSCQP